jgi:hypothetical protein
MKCAKMTLERTLVLGYASYTGQNKGCLQGVYRESRLSREAHLNAGVLYIRNIELTRP